MAGGKQIRVVIGLWRSPIPCSGRGVGAGVHLEVANYRFAGGGSAPRDKGRMAAHRFAALALTPLSGNPCRMGAKVNNLRLRCAPHDFNSSQTNPQYL